MEKLVPWERLVGLIEPHYSKGERGRPPEGVENMLRIYFLQQWYGLADEALEDTSYDSQAMRLFAGIDLSGEGVPDATAILKFRHLLEKHDLTKGILGEINAVLSYQKCHMEVGAIMAAPSSTKNAGRLRDGEMHQTKKGNQWYFGKKVPVAVDAQSGMVQRIIGTAANVFDISQTSVLLHGEELMCLQMLVTFAWKSTRRSRTEANKQPLWHMAAKRGTIRKRPEGISKGLTEEPEKVKPQVRA